MAISPIDTTPGQVLAWLFGPLERRVLEALWHERRAMTVRELHGAFSAFAYTTLMTTVDRLHKKGVLDRTKVRRAYLYEPRFGKHELELRLAARAMEGLLGPALPAAALEPLLSCFVDAVSVRDRLLLDELERLVQIKRAQLDRRGSR